MRHRIGWVALSLSLAAAALGCRARPTTETPGASPAGAGEEVHCEPGCDDPERAEAPAGAQGCGADGDDGDEPGPDGHPQLCQVDADCLVGTPRDCCTSFCPEHAAAWSHAAWLRYQEECSLEDCAVVESLACQPERAPAVPPSARCVRERCVLR